MNEQNIYVISNGSDEYYPNNTLTNFANHFPIPFNTSDNYQIGIQEIGFSSTFRNILLPKNTSVPSLIISNCQISDRLGPCVDEEGRIRSCDVPVNFQLNEEHETGCRHWKYFLEDKDYSLKDLENLAYYIQHDTGLIMKIADNQITFEISLKQMIRFQYFWVFMHKSFKDTFGFQGITLLTRKSNFEGFTKSSKSFKKQEISKIMNDVLINNKVHRERFAMYMDEEYYAYFIHKSPYKNTEGKITYLDTSLVSNVFDLSRPQYPSYIKVVCDNIQAQVIDSNYSNYLLIFSPDYSLQSKFTYKEIESIDYVPLLNTTLSHIRIKLLDENDEYLQLQAGHATIIKLKLKKMSSLESETKTATLTSIPSKDYPDNKLYHYKVKLPQPIMVDNSWRVCINTISYPNIFATFLDEIHTRQIIFKLMDSRTTLKFEFKAEHAYTKSSLVFELDNFLKSNDIGECVLIDSHVNLTCHVNCQIKVPMAVAKVIGLNREVNKIGLLQLDFYGSTPIVNRDENEYYKFNFPHQIDLNYLKPNYIMLYTDIIKSTIIGGGYGKILKNVSIKDNNLNYALNEFKTKDYCELEHFEIDTVEIQLRAHDGKYINFARSNQEVIVNLEFIKMNADSSLGTN